MSKKTLIKEIRKHTSFAFSNGKIDYKKWMQENFFL